LLLALLLALLALLPLPLREALLLPTTRPAPVVVVELRPTVPPPAPSRSSGGGAFRSSRHLCSLASVRRRARATAVVFKIEANVISLFR
jgi:hypothetical protein